MLQVFLFGHLHVLLNGHPLVLAARPLVVPLLAYLLLHRHVALGRKTLAYAFWPDNSETNALANLRRHLYELQRLLPSPSHASPWLLTDADSVQWNPAADCWVDVAEFEHLSRTTESLVEAVALYDGDLLENLYDDWIFPERERLRQLYATDLTRLIEQHETQREYRRAIEYAERLLRHDPLFEEPYRHLMRLHALNGDRAGMVRFYNTCVTVLKRELDVEPSRETRELYGHLMKLECTPATPLVVTPGLRVRLNNLPIPLTSFIGRRHEIDQVKQALVHSRLVTLTGVGGSGKTRLALAVAAELVEAYAHGIWLVDLAPLSDPAFVPQAVATVLDLREQAGRPIEESLIDYLRKKHLLLLLDNCEHLIAACAQLVEAALQAAPDLTILTTSREALDIVGEQVLFVLPLAAPTTADLATMMEEDQLPLSHYESVQLFVERAKYALPTFRMAQENASATGRICRPLDGIPLAIELAAARLKVLTADQIAARLDDRFNLLTGGSRTALPRHQTLRAALAWSYQLLAEPERALFRRLAVFAGGFTLEAIESVCADEVIHKSQILDLLSHLVDKSLVVVVEREGGGEARYRLLETLRQYAYEELAASGEKDSVQQFHLEFFLTLAEMVEPKLHSAAQMVCLNRLAEEHDNLRAALAWCYAGTRHASARGRAKVEAGLRLAGALTWFWIQRGHMREGRSWLERFVALPTEARHARARAKALAGTELLAIFSGANEDFALAAARAEESVQAWRELGEKQGLAYALTYGGMAIMHNGDPATARRWLEESVAIFRTLEDEWGLVWSLHVWGGTLAMTGDLALARAPLEEALTRLRQLGDKWALGLGLYGTAVLAIALGDYEQAERLLSESLAVFRALGDKWGIAFARYHLGVVALHRRDEEQAAALLAESLAQFRELGASREITRCLTGFAGLCVARQQWGRAARLLGAAQASFEAAHTNLFPWERADMEQSQAAIHTQLDEMEFATAYAEGRAMSLEQAMAYALSGESETD